MKFYNDIYETKKLIVNIQKSNEILTKIKKASFQPEEENTKENNHDNLNNFNNMPSFTKMLRRALYSNSDISLHSNSYNDSSSFKGNSEHFLVQKNSNDSTQILRQIREEHMHEDNKTLLQVILEKRNNHNLNNDKDRFNCRICIEENDKNDNFYKKGNNINNYNNDLLVMISTTKGEVEKIQSKVETAKKINQSYSCNECIKRININNSNTSQNNINDYLYKEKNKKYSIDESKKLSEKNIENISKNIENKVAAELEKKQKVIEQTKTEMINTAKFFTLF